MKKWICSILIGGILLLSMSGCQSAVSLWQDVKTEAKDQLANLTQSNNKYVQMVKNGSPVSYPNVTYDQAFGNFFASSTWKHLDGTKVVEFTGYCQYDGVDVKALIQFTVDEDSNTFECSYLSFNEVSQNMLQLLALIDQVFSEYENSHPAQPVSSQPSKPVSSAAPTSSTNNGKTVFTQAMANQYKATLRQYSKDYMEYTLYDINKDNIPELIVDAEDVGYDVYTISGNQAVVCGELFAYPKQLYGYDGNGIVCHDGGAGGHIETLTLYDLTAGSLWPTYLMDTGEGNTSDDIANQLNQYRTLEYSFFSTNNTLPIDQRVTG